MFQPGNDTNYPSSSGNVPAGLMSQSFTFQGFHITAATIAVVILLLIVWNMARRRR